MQLKNKSYQTDYNHNIDHGLITISAFFGRVHDAYKTIYICKLNLF